MIFIQSIKALLDRANFEPTIYSRKPAKPEGSPVGLTQRDRNRDKRYATDRGYRRFKAEFRDSV